MIANIASGEILIYGQGLEGDPSVMSFVNLSLSGDFYEDIIFSLQDILQFAGRIHMPGVRYKRSSPGASWR
jgi:hypothetical protein